MLASKPPLSAAEEDTFMTTHSLRYLSLAGLSFAALLATSATAQAQDEFPAPLTAVATSDSAALASDPVLIDAIKPQNAISGSYDQAKIDALDAQWRAEVDAASKPLIDATLGNAASMYLTGVQEEAMGKYTERSEEHTSELQSREKLVCRL